MAILKNVPMSPSHQMLHCLNRAEAARASLEKSTKLCCVTGDLTEINITFSSGNITGYWMFSVAVGVNYSFHLAPVPPLILSSVSSVALNRNPCLLLLQDISQATSLWRSIVWWAVKAFHTDTNESVQTYAGLHTSFFLHYLHCIVLLCIVLKIVG